MQLFILVPIEANDFSSFLSANASLGEFWIYKEFLRKKNQHLLLDKPLLWIKNI